MTASIPVAVIGAGPAGLATSRELSRLRLDHVVLERGSRVGHTWSNLYDSLVLHTGKHLSALPGMPFPRQTALFPTRLEFLDYLERYARTFGLPVQTGTLATGLVRDRGEWAITASAGAILQARAVVIATGIVSNPHLADLPGRDTFGGRIMHSADYRRPEGFRSRRVLVAGAGNSAGEIAAELAANGALVTIAVRSGARVVPRQLLGIPIQYLAVALSGLPPSVQRAVAAATSRASELIRGRAVLPRPHGGKCSDVPLIGFHLVDALRAGSIRLKGGIAKLTAHGAHFVEDAGAEESFDDIILATGYRAAIGLLGDRIRRDSCGFAARRRRVVSCDQSDLYFVGHNYDTRGALRNIAQDATLAAKLIRSRLESARST